MKKITVIMAVLIAVLSFIVFPARQDKAAEGSNDILPLTYKSGKDFLTVTDKGYMRFIKTEDGLFAEDYDKSFNIKSRKSIKSELSYFETFYAGKDYYYLVFGQNNLDEVDDKEVIRVVKYDRNWKRLGAAKMHGNGSFGNEIRYPFDVATTELAECNGELFLVTGHEGYVDPQYNQGHQGFLMFAIKISDMSWEILSSNLAHSFSQHIVVDDKKDIYVYEESEGSRATTLGKVVENTAWYIDGDRTVSRIKVMQYGGERTSAWAIATYATADDLETSSNNIIGLGSSIDQSKYDDSSYKKTYNIYLTVTPKNNFTEDKTKVKWLTTDNDNYSQRNIKIVKINTNRFLVLWERYTGSDDKNGLNYCFIDGSGNKLTKIYRQTKAHMSSCEPVLSGGKVSYCYSDNTCVRFISIDASEGTYSAKEYRLAGPAATWSFKDGVLTISGTGEVKASFAQSMPADIRLKVKTIVVEEGITSLGENAFSNIPNVTTIKLPGTLTKIGSRCFAYDSALTDVYIKPSVKTIGDDLTWTGSYWVSDGSPVQRRVNIHCKPGSYADQFAQTKRHNTVYPQLLIADKTAAYNKEPQAVDPAGMADVSGSVSYKYYTDKDCKNQVTPADNGSLKTGSAPSNVGTYYVKAAVNDPYWGKITSNVAVLKINKDPNTKSNMVLRYTSGKKIQVNIICGNTMLLKTDEKYTWISYSSSDAAIASVDQEGNIKAVKAGSVQVTSYSSLGTTIFDIRVLYKDVKDPGDFWYEPTYYLTDSGVVKGYDEQTKFKPANVCTRAQMVTFIWRLEGCPKPKAKTCRFGDVKKEDYFYKAVIWGNENHIVEGYSDGTFGPRKVCARRHAVTFLWRLAGKPEPKTTKNKFSDVKTSDYFYKATLWASEKKILAGYDDGTFRPDGECLRRQMVTFLYKYDKFVNDKG